MYSDNNKNKGRNNINNNYKTKIHDSLYYESWKLQLKAHTTISTETVDLNSAEYYVIYMLIGLFQSLKSKETGIILVNIVCNMS